MDCYWSGHYFKAFFSSWHICCKWSSYAVFAILEMHTFLSWHNFVYCFFFWKSTKTYGAVFAEGQHSLWMVVPVSWMHTYISHGFVSKHCVESSKFFIFEINENETKIFQLHNATHTEKWLKNLKLAQDCRALLPWFVLSAVRLGVCMSVCVSVGLWVSDYMRMCFIYK